MPDTRTIAELETERFFWIGADCCKGTVWVPFRMLRDRMPAIDTMTIDEVGARLRCDRCGRRPEKYYPSRQSDAPGFARTF